MASASGASSVASSSDGVLPRKVVTGGFLMYIKSALNGRCQETCDQAEAVQDAYTTMSSQEKKSLVDGFWKAGGKKMNRLPVISSASRSDKLARTSSGRPT